VLLMLFKNWILE